MTSAGWRALFNHQENDGIVQRTSHENGLNADAGRFDGYMHSPGTKHLGFEPPCELDPPVPQAVIVLLNTPLTNEAVYKKINP